MAYITNTVKNVVGSEISIDDALLKKDIQLEGDTYQYTTTGKNLLPTNSFTLVKGTNRTIQINFPTPIPAGTYTISCKIKTKSGFTSSTGMGWAYYDSSVSPAINRGNLGAITDSTTSPYTFTRTITGQATHLYAYISSDLDNSATIVLEDIMLESGSSATTYEPYTNGASPNPDYSQNIEVVTGNQNISIRNKNLFDSWEIGKSIHSVNGAITNDNNSAISGYIPVDFNTNSNYYISGLTNTLNSYVGAYNSNKQFLGRTAGVPTKFWTLTSNSFTSGTPQGTGDIAYLIVRQYVLSGTSTGTIDDVSSLQTQLEIGSSATTYIAPQGQNYEINLGKNLINTTAYNKAINGTTGAITTPTTPSNYLSFDDYVDVKPNTTYTISFEDDDSSATLYLASKDINGNFIERISLGTSRTFTTGNNVHQIFLYVYKSNGNFVSGGWVQLEKGDKVTPYSPYFTPIELCKIGTYQDYLYKSGENWYKHSEIGKITYNGTENDFAIYNSTASRTVISTGDITNMETLESASIAPNLLCNYFIPVSTNTTWTYGMVSRRQQNNKLYFTINSGETTDSFKTWLSTHNTIVYYVLETPVEEQITDTDLINKLESIRLLEGVNNISISSDNLSATLNLDYYSQENPYEDVIYSQDDENDIKIWFNDVELEDAGEYVELLTMTSRILPNDGKKRFSLSSFISKELELTIHNIDLEDIQDQVKISIGTLVDNEYTYVPLGVFNIQDTPVNNHNKYIIKLRDNRAKFDFGYNARELIDNQYIVTTDTTYLMDKEYYSYSDETYTLLVVGTDYEVGDEITGTIYQKKGSATKRQIYDDICSKAGVESTVAHFDGEDDEVGIYDNTINANVYIAYLAEQCGCIATIDREGKLKFVDLTDPYVWRIPLSLISDDYKLGTPFEIKRVVYESGTIKYETSDDETLDTLYLNGANPYITTQEQVDNIFDKLEGFRIDSVTTNNFLGNPAIDSYDIIEVYDDEDASEPVVFRTLANMFYTFNGKHLQNIDTQIGVEARTENVTKTSEATFRKWATTSINNAEAQIKLQAGKIDDANENIAQLQINTESISSQVTDVTNDLQNQITTNQTAITQTSDALLIEQSKTTGLQSAVSDLQTTTENNSQQLNTMSNYMLYQNGVLTLGERNSNFKLELEGGDNGEIRFMGNGIKLGYFNSERLYVENTTVFNEQVIAKKGDEEATNYYWHVTDDGCLDLDYGGTEE